MQRLGNEFKAQAKEKGIKRWDIRDCSICGHMCGYCISDDAEHVAYDSGCYCTGSSNLRERDWDYVALQYNMQDHPNVIKKYDDFWGFEKIESLAGV